MEIHLIFYNSHKYPVQSLKPLLSLFYCCYYLDNNSNKINSIEVSNFVQDIYVNCKKSGVSPSIILSWIIDLYTTFGDCDDSSYMNLDYDNNTENLNDVKSNSNFKQKS